MKFNVPDWDSLDQPKKGYLLTYLVSLDFSLADISDETWQYKAQWMLNYTINKQVHHSVVTE